MTGWPLPGAWAELRSFEVSPGLLWGPQCYRVMLQVTYSLASSSSSLSVCLDASPTFARHRSHSGLGLYSAPHVSIDSIG